MKLASLLSQYLYEQQRLDLPGIGTFTYMPGAYPEEENKRNKQQQSGSVSFENNPSIKDNQGLIAFISSNTGKIKALAAADLDSHLELARQFLNIGKPFLFEGIGSLVKIRSGEYGLASVASPVLKETTAASAEESTGEYSGLLMPKKEKINWRRPALVILVIVGLGLAVWGGYTVYKMTAARNKKENIAEERKEDNTTSVKPDSNINRTDSVTPASSINTSSLFKFIIENADSARAFQRLNKLKGFGLDIKMETADSVRYKLYFLLPASAADTSRMADSIRKIKYSPPGQDVLVEK